MANLADLRVLFFQECDDLLSAMAEGLRALEQEGLGGDAIHSVFRAVHSVKGGAGAFDMGALVDFAHRFETLLDDLRAGRKECSAEVMALLHRAGDHLADLISAARNEATAPEMDEKLQAGFATIAGEADVEDVAFIPDFQPLILDLATLTPSDIPASSAEKPTPCFRIRFAPDSRLYRAGHDPATFLRALTDLGALKVQLDHGDLPQLDAAPLGEAGLAWNISLTGDTTRDEIAGIFEFIEDIAEISIEQEERAHSGAAIDMPTQPLPIDSPPVQAAPAEIVQPTQQMPEVSPASPLSNSLTPPDGAKPQPAPPPAASAAALAKQAATIRVSLDRVDRLINLIGELVIKEAMLTQSVESTQIALTSDVHKGLDGVRQLASEIQESVMAIRAQPLKSVFERMHRVIREAGDATGKSLRLVTEGEETEVDKTIIEKLVDPLTHMLRNSVDHGIEDAATRLANGKSPEGMIRLSAAHRSGRIVIEVADDGAGINRAKVREIAQRKGLIAPDAALSPGEIDSLLFLPGFSSKDSVSALSGRGVGLDVVRREISALGGRVSISSTQGSGTSFIISLPLTLAILQGMLVEVADQVLVIPVTAIIETLNAADTRQHEAGGGVHVIENRGELVPVIDTAQRLGLNRAASAQNRRRDAIFVIVETANLNRAALLVDRIQDTRQVVIKSLEENYGAITGISAATVLGNGRIALILDTDEIVKTAGPTAPDAVTRPLVEQEI